MAKHTCVSLRPRATKAPVVFGPRRCMARGVEAREHDSLIETQPATRSDRSTGLRVSFLGEPVTLHGRTETVAMVIRPAAILQIPIVCGLAPLAVQVESLT